MNLRRKTPPDSLYLLLDTLCNAFGGIILLAVLVVLLTSKEKTQSSKAADSQEMLQRRLTFDAAIQNESFSLVSKQRLAIVRRDLFEQLDGLALA